MTATDATATDSALSDHRPVLIEREGRFFFHIDALGLIGSGEDLVSAHRDLQVRYTELLERARAADLLDRFPVAGSGRTPAGPAAAVTVRSDLRGFLLKTLILFGLALAVLLPVSCTVGGAVDRAVAKLRIKGGHEFWDGVEKGLVAMAEPGAEMPAERRERILAALAVLVARAKPFLDVAKPLTAGPPPAACPGPPAPSGG